MTDNLRDRIAAVAQNHVRCDDCTFAKTPQQRYRHFADAVIAELNLGRQNHYDPDCDYYRYCTDWIVPRR